MKLLIVLLAVLAGVWLWRQGRRVPPPHPPTARPTRAAAQPKEMAQCAQCGLHLPRDEALAGKHGLYCSAAHRQQAEG